MAMAPPDMREADEDFLDAVTTAFGKVIDAKSPFTAGHSERVSGFAQSLGEHFGIVPSACGSCAGPRRCTTSASWGCRARFLEKPGKLDEAEWVAMRGHAAHTQAILGRIGPLADLAPIAAAHHERLRRQGLSAGDRGPGDRAGDADHHGL